MTISIAILEAAGLAAVGAGATAAAEALASGGVVNITLVIGVALAAAVGKLLPTQIIQPKPSSTPAPAKPAV